MDSILRRAVARLDSWVNLVTGVGLNRGRTALDFRASSTDYLTDGTLAELYGLDGLAARIVRSVPQHALRQGITVACGDASIDAALRARLDELGAVERTRLAWTWARLFGGGAVFIGADDGRDPREPLDLGAVRTVRFLVDVDRRDLTPQDWETDPLSARFGQPRRYLLTRNGPGAGTANALVHWTRIIRFEGVETERHRRDTLQGWGDSVLQRVYTDLQSARGAYASSAGLVHEASQAVWKVKDLFALMASDKEDVLKKRLELMDMARSVARAVAIDADGEEFTRVEVGAMTGLVELLDRFTNMISASSEIPVTVLMGQAPAGLNATGESDIRTWYDAVQAEREAMLRPRVEYLVRILLRAKDSPTGGVEPQGWKVTFPPLWQPTPGEQADLRGKVATTDVAYIQAGVVTPEEVARSRFPRDGWSPETSIDLAARATSPDGIATGGDGALVDHDAVAAIIGKVAAREIPRDAGVALLRAHVGEQAEQVMGEAGRTFFTAPPPGHAEELAAARAEAAAAKRSQMSAKAMLGRVLERNRRGELVVNPIGPGGEDIEPGDVVQVEEPPPGGQG